MPIQRMQTGPVREVGQSLGRCTDDAYQIALLLWQAAGRLSAVWSGSSSQQFTNLIEPELRRLAALVEEGVVLRGRLLREVDEWEQVDSRFGDSAGSSAIGDIVGSAIGVIGGPGPGGPFRPDGSYNLGALIDYDPQYSDDLGGAMEAAHGLFVQCVRGNCPGPDSAEIIRLAAALGITPEEAAIYLRQTAAQVDPNDTDNPALNPPRQSLAHHWGSHRQLMFGRVVGDHLNLHPAFAAFLSPTGGIIGPSGGNIASRLDNIFHGQEIDNAMDYHGAAHDAFGYLYNHHGQGPGYQYAPYIGFHVMESSSVFFVGGIALHQLIGTTRSPLMGQLPGYIYWMRQQGVPEPEIEAVMRGIIENTVSDTQAVAGAVVDAGRDLAAGVSDTVAGVGDAAYGQVRDALDGVISVF